MGDDTISLAYLFDELGRAILPCFTGTSQLLRWDAGCSCVAAPARTFLHHVLDGPFVGLVVNAQSKACVFLDCDLLAALVDGRPACELSDEELGLLRDWSSRRRSA